MGPRRPGLSPPQHRNVIVMSPPPAFCSLSLLLLVDQTSGWVASAPGRVPAGPPASTRWARMMAGAEDLDWREARARLVAQEKQATASAEDGFVYESPLIEQGTVLLGGTKQAFGFGLRQQFFHKCVLLLLQHDEGFTKGIILNRPSALTLDGWRLWFGGDVAQGGLFRKHEPWKTSLEKESTLTLTLALALASPSP